MRRRHRHDVVSHFDTNRETLWLFGLGRRQDERRAPFARTLRMCQVFAEQD